MKRLLKISLDAAIFSLIPILSWFMLGFIVNKDLINVFTITYPIQFIWALMRTVFGVSPNICKEKENNPNAVMSGITLGIVVGFFVFGFIVLNIDSYINFMNMDVDFYHDFTVYSIISLYIQLIFALLLEKLYYEEKNVKANIYTVSFNLINFLVLMITSLLIKDQILIIFITLISILIYVLIMLYKESDEFKFDITVLKSIKYSSLDICNNILFFVIFLFGLSNTTSYGANYLAALNFVALLTDTQWDTFESISTIAKIDISKDNFNYKEHRANAYKLMVILLTTILIMFLAIYWFYDIDYKLFVIYLLLDLTSFVLYPIFRIKNCYLQLEWSVVKTTSNKIVASILRIFLSLMKTPFCTGIGQLGSYLYQFISVSFIFNKHYKVSKSGIILKRCKKK